ncbi:hypothetical protein K9U40_16180 [Xanthobacter autotrophicus]|uniref:hypothetical protein n=1 Tax=Xanthobacter TaxID=279 RepID=UPI0024AB28CD|nr:hypothetical protein [Xanthobacter autotrophicus]MDI4665849.1 hypothetical protein [Xanthobacter autotrophicus]
MARRLLLRDLLARLALAYLLVGQLLLGGAAAAQHAAMGLAVDAHVLCTGGGSAPSAPDAAHDALCCLMGCTASGAQPLVDAGPVAFLAPPARLRLARFAIPAHCVVGVARTFAFEATGPPARA